jgi:hypothetical protein
MRDSSAAHVKGITSQKNHIRLKPYPWLNSEGHTSKILHDWQSHKEQHDLMDFHGEAGFMTKSEPN